MARYEKRSPILKRLEWADGRVGSYEVTPDGIVVYGGFGTRLAMSPFVDLGVLEAECGSEIINDLRALEDSHA